MNHVFEIIPSMGKVEKKSFHFKCWRCGYIEDREAAVGGRMRQIALPVPPPGGIARSWTFFLNDDWIFCTVCGCRIFKSVLERPIG